MELEGGTAILSSCQGSLLQRVTFQREPEGGEGGSHEGQQLEKSVSGRRKGSKGRSAWHVLETARRPAWLE